MGRMYGRMQGLLQGAGSVAEPVSGSGSGSDEGSDNGSEAGWGRSYRLICAVISVGDVLCDKDLPIPFEGSDFAWGIGECGKYLMRC